MVPLAEQRQEKRGCLNHRCWVGCHLLRGLTSPGGPLQGHSFCLAFPQVARSSTSCGLELAFKPSPWLGPVRRAVRADLYPPRHKVPNTIWGFSVGTVQDSANMATVLSWYSPLQRKPRTTSLVKRRGQNWMPVSTSAGGCKSPTARPIPRKHPVML